MGDEEADDKEETAKCTEYNTKTFIEYGCTVRVQVNDTSEKTVQEVARSIHYVLKRSMPMDTFISVMPKAIIEQTEEVTRTVTETKEEL